MRRYSFILLMGLCICYPGVGGLAQPERLELRGYTIIGRPPIAHKPNVVLHPYLLQVVQRKTEAEWNRLRLQGAQWGFRWQNGRVLVRILPEPEAGEAVLDRLRTMPGVMVHVAYPSSIEALVDPSALDALAHMPGIRQVTHPRWLKPMAVVSEGLGVVGARSWQSLPRLAGTLMPTRVGIVDIGFQGYRRLIGDELPPSRQIHTRNFRSDGDFESTDHGTAVLEIIADFTRAPEFYLAAVSTTGELAQAIRWLRSQGVQFISGSIGTLFRAGHGCCGPEYDEIRSSRNRGIVSVFAAGNQALSHWFAPSFDDPDGDGWLNFQGPVELNCFPGVVGESVTVVLVWFDWPTSARDYDLYIIRLPDGAIVAASTNPQTGTQEPLEFVDFVFPQTGTFCAAIRRVAGGGGVPVELFIDTFVCGGRTPCFEYTVPSRSILSPADSPHAIAVGGVVWNTDVRAPYSSQGPTLDGRLKPDISAPTHVTTRTFGQQGFLFAGTSAAVPHVTGALALMHFKVFFAFPGSEVYTILAARSLDRGPKGPDPEYGVGRLFMLPPR